MNYTELSTAIQDYTQNSETTFKNHINDFIIAAEDKIFMSIQMPAFWKSDADQVCVEGTAEYALDPGVVDIFSVRVSEGTLTQSSGVQKGPSRYLLRKDYDFLLEAYPGIATASVKSATITSISKAAEALVTADNTFSNDDIVLLDGVAGMTEVNGNYYVVSDVTASNFKLKSSGAYVDSSGFTTYVSGGIASDGLSTGTPKYYAVSSASVLASTVVTNGTFASGSTDVTSISDTSSISVGMKVSGAGIADNTVVASVPTATTVTLSIATTALGAGASLTFSVTNPTMTIRFGPVPNAVYPFTVDYYGKTVGDSITAGSTPAAPLTTKTWLSVTAPDALLYGALVQAYTFMKGEPDMIQAYESKFVESLMFLKNMGEERQTDDVYVSGTQKVPVQ